MNERRFGRTRWIGACLSAMLASLSGTALAMGPGIGSDVDQALRHASRVRVMVVLQDDDAKARRERSTASIESAETIASIQAQVVHRTDALLRTLPSPHYTLKRRFAWVPALALEIDATALRALRASPQVRRVDLDAGGRGAMMQSGPIVRINETFVAGLTGAGAKIAVVDSGIDTDHPDFSTRIVAQQCFCSGPIGSEGCCPNAADTMSGAGSAEDDLGHGTHVAGVAASAGAVSTRGAAPAAQIVAVKVLDDGNSFCCASDIVAALDWIAQHHPDARAVNTSLGTGVLFPGDCDTDSAITIALAAATDALLANGTLLFASSGNSGSASQISAPACLSRAVAVGATWDNQFGLRTAHGCTSPTGVDRATCFSNSNDRVDLYAPGAEVTSSGIGGGVATYVGTSQSSPLAAGCATALRAAFPAATPTQVRAALRASPTTLVDPKNGLAFPRLDCADAALQLSDPDRMFFDGFEF